MKMDEMFHMENYYKLATGRINVLEYYYNRAIIAMRFGAFNEEA